MGSGAIKNLTTGSQGISKREHENIVKALTTKYDKDIVRLHGLITSLANALDELVVEEQNRRIEADPLFAEGRKLTNSAAVKKIAWPPSTRGNAQ